jgi:CheY-like chemotaxis protein
MKRVLVVDDEPFIQQLIGEVLQDEGYRVLFASTGRSTLQLLETEQPDLVLLDVMMPDGDGHTVLAAMQSLPHLRDIPVVIVSTGISRRKREQVATSYIDKPFTLEQLLAAVINTIGPASETEQS